MEDRILSDARKEAEDIVAAAEEEAKNLLANADACAEELYAESEAEIRERAKGIYDGKSAAARLDSAKALLQEKRRVLDTVYACALKKLNALSAKECCKLTERLLTAYAEEGDEIVFSENYPCAREVAELPVVREKKLTVSKKRAAVDGGFLLKGKTADKDLSYGALLAEDRELHQAELAEALFQIR